MSVVLLVKVVGQDALCAPRCDAVCALEWYVHSVAEVPCGCQAGGVMWRVLLTKLVGGLSVVCRCLLDVAVMSPYNRRRVLEIMLGDWAVCGCRSTALPISCRQRRCRGGHCEVVVVTVAVDVDVARVVVLVMMKSFAPNCGTSNRSCLFGRAHGVSCQCFPRCVIWRWVSARSVFNFMLGIQLGTKSCLRWVCRYCGIPHPLRLV
jgi:hypothetical protein